MEKSFRIKMYYFKCLRIKNLRLKRCPKLNRNNRNIVTYGRWLGAFSLSIISLSVRVAVFRPLFKASV